MSTVRIPKPIIKFLFIILIGITQNCSPDITEISNIKAIETDFNAKLPVARISGKVIDFFKTVKSDQFKVLGDSSMVIYSKHKINIPNANSYIIADFKASSSKINIDLMGVPRGTTTPSDLVIRLPDTIGKVIGDIGKDTRSIDSILFAAGNIEIKVEINGLGVSSIEVDATLTSIKNQNGKPTSIEGTLGQTGAKSITRELTNHTLVNSTSAVSNKVEFDYKIKTTLRIPKNTKIESSAKLGVTVSIKDALHKIIFGDIKREVTTTSDLESIKLDVLGDELDKSFSNFNVTFTNPVFIIKAENGYGVPFELRLTNVYVERKNGSAKKLVDKSNKSISLQQGSAKYESGVLLPTKQVHTIDSINSNIADLFAELPKSLYVQFQPILDPNNTRNNYIGKNSNFSADIEMQVPMSGIWDASISKEFEQNGADDLKNVELDYITLEVDYENEIPLVLTLDLKNQSGNSLIKIPLESAVLKNDLYITKKDVILIKMDGEKAKELLSISKLKLDISLKSNKNPVLIKANQKFTMNWSMNVKLKEYKF